MAVLRLHDRSTPPGEQTTPSETLPITVCIDPERTMTPQQQACWEWFVQEVHRRLARDQQQVAPSEDPTP
jgi:hypothetical protein